jgi:hypothetical protein
MDEKRTIENINFILFRDDEENTVVVYGNKTTAYIKSKFKKEYKKLNDEYYDGNTEKREFMDFYDELWMRLKKYDLILLYQNDLDDKILYYNNL